MLAFISNFNQNSFRAFLSLNKHSWLCYRSIFIMTGNWESVSHLEVSRNIPYGFKGCQVDSRCLCLISTFCCKFLPVSCMALSLVFLDRVQMIVPLITFCCHADSLYCFVNIPKSDLSFICSFQMQLLSLFLCWRKSLPHVFSNWSKSDPEIFWRSNANRWHDQIMSLNHVVQMMLPANTCLWTAWLKYNSITIMQTSLSLLPLTVVLPWVVVWMWNPPWGSVN